MSKGPNWVDALEERILLAIGVFTLITWIVVIGAVRTLTRRPRLFRDARASAGLRSLGVRWPVLSASVVLAGAACAAAVPPEPTPTPVAVIKQATLVASPVVVQPAAPAGPGIPAIVVRAVASPSPLALPLASVAGRSGADVRVALDHLLQEHTFLTTLAIDAAGNARLDELLGVSGALDQNGLVLAEVLGAIKGQAVAESFVGAWRAQNADLIQSGHGQTAAVNIDLGQRELALAEQLALDDFSAGLAQGLLRTRNQTQLGLAAASISHDPVELTTRLRLAAAGADDLARPMAAAIAGRVPSPAAPPTEGPDIDVRLGLNRLLVAHVYVTGAALEAAADDRAVEVQARVDGANASADDLGRQLAAVWGPDLGTAVADRLRAQTAALVGLAAGGNRAQAAADVDRLRGELDGLLSGANPLLPKGMLKEQLRPSDQPMLAAADAFAARDFVSAYARLREASRQMQKPADALALSIVDRYPGRFLVRPNPG